MRGNLATVRKIVTVAENYIRQFWVPGSPLTWNSDCDHSLRSRIAEKSFLRLKQESVRGAPAMADRLLK